MKYIQWMGGVWKLSNKSYKKLLTDLKTTGDGVNLDDYGTMITGDLDNFQDLIDEAQGGDSFEDE